MDTYYRVLGVTEDASFKTMKAAYRHLAILLHPDKNPAPSATEAFQRLVHAWDILKDDKTRGAYNNQLKAAKQKHQPPAWNSCTSDPFTSNPFTSNTAYPSNPNWTRKHTRHDDYEERVFSHQWTPLTSHCRPPKPPPTNPL